MDSVYDWDYNADATWLQAIDLEDYMTKFNGKYIKSW